MPRQKYKPKQGKHGSIYKVAKGVIVRQNARRIWLLCIERGGVRKNITFGDGRDARDEALKAAEMIAESLGDMVFTGPEEKKEPETPRFKVYSKKWLEDNTRRWKPRTHERYNEILRIHVWSAEIFRDKCISEISRADIKYFLRNLYKIRSSATVELAQTVLCSIFEEAIEDQLYLHGNPTRKILKNILPPKKKRNMKDPAPFTIEERDLFLTKAEKIYSPGLLLLLKLMLYCGLRLGEALAVRVRHFDLNRKTYHVTESFYRQVFDKPKADKCRWVDLPAPLLDEIRNHIAGLRKESLKAGNGGVVDLMFPDPEAKNRIPYSQRKIQNLVKKVCTRAGLDVRNPHDLRHTYATIMLMSGKVRSAYIKEQLGHSSIEITVDIYGHWIPGEGRDGLEDALRLPVQNRDENRIFSHIKNEKGCNLLRLQP
jgi:integrase